MDRRFLAFESYKTHAWLCRVYRKLSREELSLAHAFLREHSGLDKGAFEQAAVRLFLDKVKPKNWTAIEELLVCANSAIQD